MLNTTALFVPKVNYCDSLTNVLKERFIFIFVSITLMQIIKIFVDKKEFKYKKEILYFIDVFTFVLALSGFMLSILKGGFQYGG
jgi:hypothetical protein